MRIRAVRVGDILKLERRAVVVESEKLYREIGVRSFGRGLFEKEPTSGVDLGSKRVFYVHPGDLVVSNIFAWEGAVAVAQDRHRGMIGSHRFMTWTPVSSEVDVEYLWHFFASDPGLERLGSASPGSAGRNRTLSIKNFEDILIPLPEIGRQLRIATHLDALESLVDLVAQREKLVRALPASARNEIFSAMV
jgi:Restriction endonuclease S subunits